MLKVDQAMDILDLHRQGHSIRAITQLTGTAQYSSQSVAWRTFAPAAVAAA